ncbi:cysteine desulfurase [Bacillus mesophilus]|uniref:cysteine desulfurase n=1 Tax=Bacillus mesophilus TaxID=1808955 RepID=A0A6M0Q623_9BACI|nr:cysteine desulfurase family protein [Bacillus mesophilus]MBM7660710.1 cysteine desulfurase [Bacillus mesophilus]NEY71744.1 cysteine desulfurase [Bacillus mesophilus]
MREPIYVDHAATSPLHPVVAQEMLAFMTTTYGNPSSIHSFGRKSRHALDQAREVIAASIGAKESEIIFTSGGTEADNLAIIGMAFANKEKGSHIITSAIEHHAVLHTCNYLEQQGFEVTYLPVGEDGVVKLDDVRQALRNDTILVTIMLGNNEVGAIQPIEEIAVLLEGHQAYLHTDAVQAFGALPVSVNHLKVDALSVSGHKINGPKGTGFLYVKEGTKLVSVTYGGEQERKRRAGTENVPGIIGLMHAVTLSQQEMNEKQSNYSGYKQILIDTFMSNDIDFAVNGDLNKSLPHIINIHFPGINVESFLVNLDLAGIAASSGSACTAGSIDPSHVLCAMYGSESDRGKTSIRFSFGLGNTKEQIQKVAEETVKIVKRLTRR